MEKIESFKELVDSFQGNHDLAFSSFENATNITYNDLHHQIYLYIDKLHEIDKDDKVVLFNLPNIEWICIYFAVILKNGIIVPVDTRVSESFLHSVIENIKPKIIISNSLEQSTVKSLTVKELLTRKSITTSVSTNKKTSEKVSEILFTSGTWGIPKGVMLSQKNLLTNAYQILDIYHHKKEDTSLSILPMSHAYQQTAGLIIPLIVGSHVVFLEKPDSFKIIEAIKKYKIKTIPVVPKVLDLIKSSILRKIQINLQEDQDYLDIEIKKLEDLFFAIQVFIFNIKMEN
jgi:long-chain acyl-CoA synthetase